MLVHTGTGNSLAVTLILDITASEDTLNVGEAGTGLGDNVTLIIELDLALDQSVGRVVTNSVEKTVGIHDLLLLGDHILDTEVGHQAIRLVLTDDLGGNGVEANLALGVSKQTLSHDLGSTKLVLAHKNSHLATVLGEEHSFLGSRVTTSNDVKGLVTEDGDSTVADSAGTDTVLPEGLFTGEVETTGIGTSGNDDGVGGANGLAAFSVVPFGPHLEGAGREVQLGDGLGDDFGTETLGLRAHVVHELGTANAIGESGEVLDIRRRGELATCGGAVGEHTLVQDGLELSAREVDGGGVRTRAGANDWGLLEWVPVGD